MEHEGDSDTNFKRCTWNNPQTVDKEPRRLRNMRTSGEHLNNRIIYFDQNNATRPGDLKRFAVTKTPEKMIS